MHPAKLIGRAIDDVCARAACYVPLYDALCEIVTAIKDDPEAGREMKALARRGRKTLDQAKKLVARAET